jgi:hypothetical protein
MMAMLIAMPFRALTGYFVGQASTPIFSIIASVLALRKELSIKAEPYWTNDIIHRFLKLFSTFAVIGIVDGFYLLVESTVLRQRLPDLDSAGYYMATRFSEIASFLSATLVFTIFPFAAQKAADKEDYSPLIIKSLVANACFCLVLVLPFICFGKSIFSCLPHGEQYVSYWWSVPWLIGITYLNSIIGLYLTAEFSSNRFDFLKWYLPLDIAYPILLLLITGHKYFVNIIPTSWTDFLTAYNIYSLKTMLIWMNVMNTIKASICLIAMYTRKSD